MFSASGGVGRGSRQRQRGAATLEYVLIAIVAGLGVMFALYRFSGSVGGRFEQVGKINESATSGDSTGLAEDTLGGGSGGTGGGVTSGGGTASADVPEPTPIPLRRQDGKARVGNFEVDFSLIIWIGVFFLIVVVLIVMRVFAAARKKPKVKVKT
jgi:Flp pilus assembly pilin Flp